MCSLSGFDHKSEKAFWKKVPSWYQLGNDFFYIKFKWFWCVLDSWKPQHVMKMRKMRPRNARKPKFPSWYQLGKNSGSTYKQIITGKWNTQKPKPYKNIKESCGRESKISTPWLPRTIFGQRLPSKSINWGIATGMYPWLYFGNRHFMLKNPLYLSDLIGV